MDILSTIGLPIGVAQWDDFKSYKQSIVDFCFSQYKPNTIESNISPRSKNNLWESKFNFLENDELTPLKLWVIDQTTKFVNTVNSGSYRIAITESWAHVTDQYGSHAPHRHPNSTWSGIFYVEQLDLTSGQNIFFNQYTMPDKLGYEFFNEEFTIDIQLGRLVLFPSTMLHYAKPYLGTDKRIVIAYNSICI